jgi:hypothetical protein
MATRSERQEDSESRPTYYQRLRVLVRRRGPRSPDTGWSASADERVQAGQAAYGSSGRRRNEVWNDYVLDEWCAAAPDQFIPLVMLPY